MSSPRSSLASKFEQREVKNSWKTASNFARSSGESSDRPVAARSPDQSLQSSCPPSFAADALGSNDRSGVSVIGFICADGCKGFAGSKFHESEGPFPELSATLSASAAEMLTIELSGADWNELSLTGVEVKLS